MQKSSYILNWTTRLRYLLKEEENVAVVAVVVWQLDLQLPMQSVSIATNVVSLNPAHCEVYQIQHYVIKFVSDLPHVSGFLWVLLISYINKTDRHDITEILLKVALNTINLTLTLQINANSKYIDEIVVLFNTCKILCQSNRGCLVTELHSNNFITKIYRTFQIKFHGGF